MTKKQSKATRQSAALFPSCQGSPHEAPECMPHPPLFSPCPLEKPRFINYKPFHFLQGFDERFGDAATRWTPCPAFMS